MTPPHAALTAPEAAAFTGRDWVFRRLDEWLGPGGPQTFLLTGDPGTGKSAVAARVVHIARGEVAAGAFPRLAGCAVTYAHFCRAFNDPTIDPRRFAEGLSQKLAEWDPRFAAALASADRHAVAITSADSIGTIQPGGSHVGIVIENLDLGGLPVRAAFDRLVRKPLEQLPADLPGTVLMVVDALDEALTYHPTNNLVALLARGGYLPPRVRLLLTSRRDDRVHGVIGPSSLDLIDDAPEGIDDVRTYAHSRLSALPEPRRGDLADRVASAGKGNFLYARYVLDDLLPHLDQATDLSRLKLPKGLNEVYREFLRRELGREPQWSGRNRRLFGALAVARGAGLNRRELAGVSGLALSEASDVLRAAAQYLTGAPPDGPFTIYHQSFREFLLTDAEFPVYPEEANRAVADFFLQEYGGSWRSCPDRYALEHTATHLGQAARAAARRDLREALARSLGELVTDGGFLEAKAAAGLVFQLPQDLGEALRLLPDGSAARRRAGLLDEALRRDLHFVARHPAALFQCLWNTCWWYDCPEAVRHYDPPEGGWPAEGAPWARPGDRLSVFLERWKEAKERAEPGFRWVRSLRPPPLPLGAPQRMVFGGDTGSATGVAFVPPDGQRIVSASLDGDLRLWDRETGKKIVGRKAHDHFINDIAVSPDGRRLVSGSEDETAKLWGLEVGIDLLATRAGPGGVLAVAFSPAGDRIAVADPDGITICDATLTEEVMRLEGLGQRIAFSRDGKRLYAASRGSGEIDVFDLEHGRPLPALAADEYSISCLACSPAGDRLAAAGQERVVRVWEMSGGRLLAQFPTDDRVNCLAFSPDGTRVAAGSDDRTIRVWDVAGQSLRAHLRGHEQAVISLAYSPDGLQLASGSQDLTMRLWDVAGRVPQYGLPGSEAGAAAFSPRGNLLATGTADGRVWLWDARQGTLIAWVRGHAGTVWDVAYSPDGRRLASCGEDGVIRVWGVASALGPSWRARARALLARLLGRGRELRLPSTDLRGHRVLVRGVGFSGDGSRLASCSGDGTIRQWDAATGEELARFPTGREHVWCVAFSPDGRVIASGSHGGLIELRDAESGRGQLSWQAHDRPVADLCFSPDGTRLVSRVLGGRLRVWDARTGQRLDETEGTGDAAAVAAGAAAYPLWAFAHRSQETEIVAADRKQAVAWFPIGYTLTGIRTHPGGKTWAEIHQNQLYLFTLEGRGDLPP